MDSQELLIKPFTSKRMLLRHLRSFFTMFHKRRCLKDAWREQKLVEDRTITLRPSKLEFKPTLTNLCRSLTIISNLANFSTLMPPEISPQFTLSPRLQCSLNACSFKAQKLQERRLSVLLWAKEPTWNWLTSIFTWKKMDCWAKMMKRSLLRSFKNFHKRLFQELSLRTSHKM